MEFAVNYIAVVVAAIAFMAIGMLWYGPVFGAQWMGYMGFTKESMKSMPLSPTTAMAGGLVTSLIMAFALAVSASVLGVADTAGALKLGAFLWIGFVATTQFGSYLWEGKPVGLFVLNAGNTLVAMLVISLIIVHWPW